MKRIVSLFLALAAALLLSPGLQTARAAEAEDYIAAVHTRSNGQPYYLMVNRAQNTVTVYALGEDGCYSVPVKAMVCSVGREGHATPAGTFSIGGRWTWLHMVDNSYGQYATQIRGSILFHSVCYTKKDPSALMTFEYNALGERASLGCVRLQTADAKWIYDNCARGTKVTVYDGREPGPLGKPDKYIEEITPEMDNGWDPTDPRENNPWHTGSGSEAAAPSSEGSTPAPAANQPVTYAHMAQALCRLAGGDDSDSVTWAVESRVLTRASDPDGLLTRQELIAMLYRYQTGYLGRTALPTGSLARFSDGQSVRAASQTAMRWAVGAGLINGTSATTLHPNNYATQVQLDIILQRYAAL